MIRARRAIIGKSNTVIQVSVPIRIPNDWINRLLAVMMLGYGALVSYRSVLGRALEAQPIRAETSELTVYFTNPQGVRAFTLRGGPDLQLAHAIDAAEQTVDAAVYQLNLWSIRDALIRAHQRGVTVQIVTEADNRNGREMLELEQAGIAIRGDREGSLMHDKFVVVDGREVWTGSMNLTVNGAYRNNNNLIRIQSERLAIEYRNEFDEMFLLDRFGPLSAARLQPTDVRIGASEIEVLFSPNGEVASRIVQQISAAQRSIHIMAYTLTLDAISEAVIERAAAGLQVRVVVDAGQAESQGSDVERLQQSGVEVILDGNPRKMHHKVIVVDEQTVITGSYNFSQSAEQFNDENVLIISDAEVARLFLAEFEALAQNGTGY